MEHFTTRRPSDLGRQLLCAGLALAGAALQAQVLINEQFTGGASTTGFTINRDGGVCDWLYAPGGLMPVNFNDGALPSGAGFDGDFAFIDSDECSSGTPSETVVNTFLTSPAFNASGPGFYTLSFSQQLRADYNSTTITVEVSDGTVWTEVYSVTGIGPNEEAAYVGYPNPAAETHLDITDAAGASTSAQVRFHFNSTWAYWWALDDITIEQGPSGVGITEQEAKSALRVFPNPTADRLFVTYDGRDAVNVKVTDLAGKPVLERPMAKSIAVDALADGAYLLMVFDAQGRALARKPFVKQ